MDRCACAHNGWACEFQHWRGIAGYWRRKLRVQEGPRPSKAEQGATRHGGPSSTKALIIHYNTNTKAIQTFYLYV